MIHRCVPSWDCDDIRFVVLAKCDGDDIKAKLLATSEGVDVYLVGTVMT